MPPTHSAAEDPVLAHSIRAETIERHSWPDVHVSARRGIGHPDA
jgi:hypothetical protein